MAGEITITYQEGPLVVDFHSVTVMGPPGRDGRDGTDGTDGTDGKDGPAGPPGADADGATDPGDLTLLFDNMLI